MTECLHLHIKLSELILDILGLIQLLANQISKVLVILLPLSLANDEVVLSLVHYILLLLGQQLDVLLQFHDELFELDFGVG